jgi:hypothetical protein
VVTSRSAEIGQVLAAGQTVLTVARPDAKEAVFDIPDAMADQLPPEALFNVVLQLDPAVSTVGRVRVIEPEADQGVVDQQAERDHERAERNALQVDPGVGAR